VPSVKVQVALMDQTARRAFVATRRAASLWSEFFSATLRCWDFFLPLWCGAQRA